MSGKLAPQCDEIAPFLYYILTQLRTATWYVWPIMKWTDDRLGFRAFLLLTYHAVFSLHQMHQYLDSQGTMSHTFRQEIGETLQDRRVEFVLGLKHLRNTYMHYGLTRFVSSRLEDANDPAALLTAHGIDLDCEGMDRELFNTGHWLADQIERWLSPPIKRIQDF